MRKKASSYIHLRKVSELNPGLLIYTFFQAVTLFAAAYTLVTNSQERGAGSKPQPLRIACLAAPLVGAPHTLPNAPALI